MDLKLSVPGATESEVLQQGLTPSTGTSQLQSSPAPFNLDSLQNAAKVHVSFPVISLDHQALAYLKLLKLHVLCC